VQDDEVRHFTAVLEDVRSKMQLLAEGQMTVSSNVRSLTRNVGILNRTVDRLVDEQEAMRKELKGHGGRLDRVEQRLGPNGAAKHGRAKK
jgi:hypothetical protein